MLQRGRNNGCFPHLLAWGHAKDRQTQLVRGDISIIPFSKSFLLLLCRFAIYILSSAVDPLPRSSLLLLSARLLCIIREETNFLICAAEISCLLDCSLFSLSAHSSSAANIWAICCCFRKWLLTASWKGRLGAFTQLKTKICRTWQTDRTAASFTFYKVNFADRHCKRVLWRRHQSLLPLK